MIDLKPCPFCGESPIITHMNDSLFDSSIHSYSVVCPKCGIGTQRDRDESKVIEAWNRRRDE